MELQCCCRYTIGLFNYSQYQPNYAPEGEPLFSTETNSPIRYRYPKENKRTKCPANTYTTCFATFYEAKMLVQPYSRTQNVAEFISSTTP
jgi:hypothetical protein